MPTDNPTTASIRQAISRGVLALLKDAFGRGPSSARTALIDDLVVVVFEDTLTKGEKLLAASDEVEIVREMRRTLIDTIDDQITELVERETGREVVARLGDHSVLPDYAFIACLLEPDAESGPTSVTEPFSPGASPNADERDAQRTITRGMVGLFKENVGRGPAGSRTYIEDNLVLVLLGETLTKAERTLAEADREERVRATRREFQDAIEREAEALVEAATGRTICAFMSDHSIFPDYALEVFALESPDEPDPAGN